MEITYNVCNFHPLKVVGRGSETQLQVGEHLSQITSRPQGFNMWPVLYEEHDKHQILPCSVEVG